MPKIPTVAITSDQREIVLDILDATEPILDHRDQPFKPTQLRITIDARPDLYVLVTGPAIRKNGELGASERHRVFAGFPATRGSLHSDTPAWIRNWVTHCLDDNAKPKSTTPRCICKPLGRSWPGCAAYTHTLEES